MELHERIKHWRHTLGLTQDEFAKLAGMSKATLVGYDVGQRKPGADALAAIARTGVNMTWLLTGEGEMLPDKPAQPASGAPEVARHDLRWQKIIELVESIEDEEERSALLEEFFARAKTAAELAELRRAVAALQKKLADTV
jgi:transcriptional regulator with XRE-family HTH domain